MSASSRIDYINIGLILISFAAAFMLPFEVFLFSYAVLGPLHYLTEIGWLHQRQYFTTGKKDYWILILLCALLSLTYVFFDVFIYRDLWPELFSDNFKAGFSTFFSNNFGILILMAFTGAIGMVIFTSPVAKVACFAAGLGLGLLTQKTSFYTVWISSFTPTLIHVYLFTGFFMLYGAMKQHSASGYLALAVFVACGIGVFWIDYVPQGFVLTEYARETMLNTPFRGVNADAIELLKGTPVYSEDFEYQLFHSRRGLMVQRFIAFAYTYHYLNWFSKTEIIKWHKVPIRALMLSIGIWLTSVALYIWDYKIGLIALFFLSLLHVFLEFPLNIRSLQGIGQELRRRLFRLPVSTKS